MSHGERTVQEINLDLCREKLDYTHAFVVSGEAFGELATPLAGDREFAIGWKEARLEKFDEVRQYLEIYTSPANTVPLNYVDDPVIEGEKFQGRWRTAWVKRIKDAEGNYVIVQLLRKGYIMSLVSGSTVDWTEARLQTAQSYVAGTCTINPGGSTTEDYVTLYWPNVSPDHAKAIVDSLTGLAVAMSPTIRGVSFGADWHRLFCTHKIEQDGSAWVILFLAKPEFTLYTFQSWYTSKAQFVTYHYNVPKELAQLLIDAEKSLGKTCVPSYENEKGLVNIVVYERDYLHAGFILNTVTSRSCSITEYADMYMGVYDPTLYNAPMYQSGWSYGKRISDNGDGSYDVQILKRHSEYREYPNRFSSISTLQTREEYEQRGVTTQVVPGIYAIRGIVYRQTRNPNDDCSSDYNTVTDKGVENVIGPVPVATAVLSQEYLKETVHSQYAVAVAGPVKGFQYTVSNNFDESGYYNIRETTKKSVPVVIPFQSAVTMFRAVNNIAYSAYPDYPVIPSTVASGEYRAQFTQNVDGTYDGMLTYETGTDDGEARFESLDSSLSHETTVIYKDRTSQVEATGAAQGSIYRTSNNLNENGTYDAQLVYKTSTPLMIPFQSAVTLFKNVNTIMYESYPDYPIIPATVNSGMYRSDFRVQEDGTYNGSLSYDTGTNAGEAEFKSTTSALSSSNEILYKSRTTQVAAPSVGTGGMYRAANNLGDDGLYDANLSYVVSTPASIAFGSRDAVLSKASVRSYKNTRSTVDAPASGVGYTYEVSEQLNQDGSVDANLTYQESAEATVAFASRNAALVNGSNVIYRNARGVVNANSNSQGLMYEVSQQVNQDGTYDSNMSAEQSVEAKTPFRSLSSRFRREGSIVYNNYRTLPQVPATIPESGIYRTSIGVNRDGTYDGNLTYQVSTGEGVVNFSSVRSFLADENSILYKDYPVVIEAGSSGVGYTYSARNSLTEDGFYDGSIDYQKSNPALTEFKSAGSIFRATRSIIYDNYPQFITLPDSTGSGVYRLGINVKQDGTYDGELTYTYGTNTGEVAFLASDTALDSRTQVVYKSRADKVEAPIGTQGAVYRADNNITEDALYDAQLVYDVSKAKSVGFTGSKATLVSEEVLTFKNSRSKIDASGPSQGVVSSVNQQMNSDFTYDGSHTYRTSVEDTVAIPAVRSIMQDVNSILYRSVRTISDLPTPSYGGVYQLSLSENVDGTYDGQVTYQNNKERSIYTTWTDRYGISSVYLVKNTSINPQTIIDLSYLDNTKNNGVSFNTNIDGTYDGSISRQAFDGGGGGGAGDWDDSYHRWVERRPGTHGNVKDMAEVYMYPTTTKTKAHHFLNDTNGIVGPGGPAQLYNLPGTSISYKGPGKWFVMRIREI